MVAIAWTRGRSLRRSVRVGAARGARSKLSETFLIRGCPHESLQSHFEGRAHLADGDDDGLEAESQDSRSECRRCREHGYIERGVEQEGHEAEESPSNKGAVRARGEASLKVQGVQRLSARSSAPSVQGVRWGINLRARSCALSLQGVRWGINLRARSSSPLLQGVRWVRNLRARS